MDCKFNFKLMTVLEIIEKIKQLGISKLPFYNFSSFNIDVISYSNNDIKIEYIGHIWYKQQKDTSSIYIGHKALSIDELLTTLEVKIDNINKIQGNEEV